MEFCPTPLQWLCEVAGYWRELEHGVVHVDPVNMQAMEELGHFKIPRIVYRFLQHGAVHYHSET
jgi:hypothetical protein